ncbi:MAG: hypothetical protein O3C21_04770 [Verrucomicrobia bacterium]|nr:hypothetical protein [Verrucomicrobiota bacterium]
MIRIPSTLFSLTLALAVFSLVVAKSHGLEVYADGTITIGAEEGKVEGDGFAVTFPAPRWGMYNLMLELNCPELKVVKTLDGKLSVQGEEKALALAIAPGREASPAMSGIPRVYIAKDGACPVVLTLPGFADKIARLTFTPVREGTAQLGSDPSGVAELGAKEALLVGKRLCYEPNPKKLCLGYWINVDDYAVWPGVVLELPGIYEVTIYQGCAKGQEGSEAELVIEAGEAFEQRFPFTVIETGGFQQFVPVTLGTVEVPEIEPIGRISVEVRAKKIANSAVMDIQKVVLSKVSPDAPANGKEGQ